MDLSRPTCPPVSTLLIYYLSPFEQHGRFQLDSNPFNNLDIPVVLLQARNILRSTISLASPKIHTKLFPESRLSMVFYEGKSKIACQSFSKLIAIGINIVEIHITHSQHVMTTDSKSAWLVRPITSQNLIPHWRFKHEISVYNRAWITLCNHSPITYRNFALQTSMWNEMLACNQAY